ncbi:MAG: tetratricopeptide repeat protein [Anaerolineales bacterium]|nr:tetratricopeptide repeat protein [Anaerolineales bacterium]
MPGSEDIFQQAMNAGHSAAWDQQWEEAADSYRKAMEEIPDHPKALTSLGLALFELQKYDEALLVYQQAARVSPNDPVPLEKVAQLSERTGNLRPAVQAANQAAELYVKEQNVEKALENWLRVTTLDPDNTAAHSRLALVHERLNHPQQAVIEYLAVASLLQRSGNADKASEMVERALKVLPGSQEAKQARNMLKGGELLPKPMRPKGGTGPLRMAQVRQMEPPTRKTDSGLDPIADARKKALTRLAEVLFDLSDESSESTLSKRGLQAIVRGTGPLSLQRGELTTIVLHLGQAIDAQTNGQDEQAAEELERALEAGFREPALYFDLGMLRAKSERLESALRHLQHAVKHIDYALGARLMMGQIYRQLERLPEAVTEFMEALCLADSFVIGPDQADEIRQLYEPLIEAHAQQDDVAGSEQLLKNIEALLLRPNWRVQVLQAREQLPKPAEGAPPMPLAEVLAQAQSSHVIEAIGRVHQIARSGHLRSAMEEAYHSLHYAPTYLPLHTLIGDLLIQDGRTQDAITKYTVVAHAYGVRGEANQAINLLRRIVTVAPMDLAVRTRLIEQLAVSGQVDAAIGEYLDLADIYYRLAELDMARKTYTTALRLAQQGGANQAWSVKLLQRMADIDVQRLDWRQALRVFEQIRTLDPDDLSVRKSLVELNTRLNQAGQAAAELDSFVAHLESHNRRSEAIPFLEGLVTESPQQGVLRRYLAEEYRQDGRVADAVAQLDALGEILLDAGDKGGAIQAIETIVAMNPPNMADYQDVLAKLKGS